jgi:hypothetical protein
MGVSNLTVRVPVTCPTCGKERLTQFPIKAVADALLSGSDLGLVAECHNLSWNATEPELDHIREYLVAEWVAFRRI